MTRAAYTGRNVHKFLLPLLLGSTASAQLQVTPLPTPATCPAGSAPVLGIALHNVLGGTYGYELSKTLKRALEKQGYRVVPEYAYPLIDQASIGIRGEAAYWKNSSGSQSKRIGDVHLTVYDIDGGKALFALDQKAARTIFGAPESEAFVQSVVNVIRQKFCQQ